MPFKAILVAILLEFVTCSSEMIVMSVGNPPASSNECAKGPEYWCANIMAAKSCRATQHCIQTVWERQVVPEDNGDTICDICKQMVQEARDQLQSNETQEQLKEVFEGSCNLLPIKMIRMNCIKVIDDFIPELIEMLSSQMNPAMVCTTALLCNNAWSDNLQAEYKAARAVGTPNGNGKCSVCQAFMTQNSRKLKAISVNNVQGVLFNVCDRLSSYSDGCKSVVSDNADKIHNFISQSLRSDACQPLGFCDEQSRISVQPKSNDRKFQAKFESSYNDNIECEFCQALIGNLRNILVSNTTEDEFIQVLNGLCKQSGPYAKECQALVAQYADNIYTFLMEELDPSQACKLLTLCPSSKGGIVKAAILMPAQRVTNHREISNDLLVGQDEANAFLDTDAFILPNKILVSNKPSCILCEYVLHQLVEDLQNTTVKEEIEMALKNVCKKLPSSVSDECNKLINNYGDALFFLLSQELDPSTMCVQLALCDASGSNEAIIPTHHFKSEVEDPNTCALCEFVISTLDKKLQDNKTEESIKFALENVCLYMPTTVRRDCRRLADAYAKELVEALVADLTPDEVCIALKLCKSKVTSFKSSSGITLGEFMQKIKKSNVQPHQETGTLGEFMSRINKGQKKIKKTKEWKSDKGSPTCVMCEYAMSALEKQFITNKTVEEMRRMVDFVCAHLPDTVADMCIDFVEQYGDEIFKLLVSQVAPKAICTQLGLCTPFDDSKLIKRVHKLGHMNEQQNLDMPSKCEVCEMVIEYLDKLLEDDTIEESIDHMLERVCLVVPRGGKDYCTNMVETYGPYLLSQLGQLVNMTKVCQSLHLCKPPAGQVQLLGGEQCTWGPTYWCVSKQHAEACNSVEHCRTKVWMKEEP